jgi:hypothetical protein
MNFSINNLLLLVSVLLALSRCFMFCLFLYSHTYMRLEWGGEVGGEIWVLSGRQAGSRQVG